jgi:hypothetical protein
MAAGRARKAGAIKLSEDERNFRRPRGRKVALADAEPSEIILRAADGLNN